MLLKKLGLVIRLGVVEDWNFMDNDEDEDEYEVEEEI